MRPRIVPIAASMLLALVSAIPVAHAGTNLQPKADPGAAAHSGFTVTPTSDPYLMAFHTCALGTECTNPMNHLIRLGSSPDGRSWAQLPGWQPYSGSVPDVFRRGNTAYVIGAGLSRVNMTTGQVTASSFSVKNAQGADALPRDASFAGQLPDGRLVLVYVPSMQAIDPSSPTRTILLATEDKGSDGASFTYSGDAIVISTASLPVRGDATDPDIYWDGSRWVLLVSLGGNTVAYSSANLLGPFEASTLTVVSQNNGGVPSAVLSTDNSTVFTYVNAGERDNVSIRLGTSVAPPSLISSWSVVIPASQFGTASAESPGVSLNSVGITCGAGCAATTASTTATTKAGKPGSRCTKAGAKGTYNGTTLTCRKKKGKLVWSA
ncbi:unannotated protein [freshwater metagenome]|uniref:Unannotated protein n=1 Tax=freshwater metagenome TaxID=449393 RepID=A0A6J6U1N2_9ZZZZ|nr:hypothetical protein [Actinomycetota bacterium]